MSSPLVQILVSVTKVTANLPAANSAFANTSVVVTDSSGTPQAAVVLTGLETTPWAFTTSVAVGAGTVVATDMDSSGNAIGSPVSQAFTEVGSPPPATFLQSTGITVTPVAA